MTVVRTVWCVVSYMAVIHTVWCVRQLHGCYTYSMVCPSVTWLLYIQCGVSVSYMAVIQYGVSVSYITVVHTKWCGHQLHNYITYRHTIWCVRQLHDSSTYSMVCPSVTWLWYSMVRQSVTWLWRIQYGMSVSYMTVTHTVWGVRQLHGCDTYSMVCPSVTRQ